MIEDQRSILIAEPPSLLHPASQADRGSIKGIAEAHQWPAHVHDEAHTAATSRAHKTVGGGVVQSGEVEEMVVERLAHFAAPACANYLFSLQKATRFESVFWIQIRIWPDQSLFGLKAADPYPPFFITNVEICGNK